MAAKPLRALADIISSRPDGADQEVRDIADSLRQMAADPFDQRHSASLHADGVEGRLS